MDLLGEIEIIEDIQKAMWTLGIGKHWTGDETGDALSQEENPNYNSTIKARGANPLPAPWLFHPLSAREIRFTLKRLLPPRLVCIFRRKQYLFQIF